MQNTKTINTTNTTNTIDRGNTGTINNYNKTKKTTRRYLSELGLTLGTPLRFKNTNFTVEYDGGKKVRHNDKVQSLSTLVDSMDADFRGSVPDLFAAWSLDDGRSLRDLSNEIDETGMVSMPSDSTPQPTVQNLQNRVQTLQFSRQEELFEQDGETLSQGTKANLSGQQNEDAVQSILNSLGVTSITLREYKEMRKELLPNKFYAVRQYEYTGFAGNIYRADFALLNGDLEFMNIEARALKESSSISDRIGRVKENAIHGPFIKTLAVLSGDGFKNARISNDIEEYKKTVENLDFVILENLHCFLSMSLLKFYQIR